jgi:hypothetical protein
MARLKHDAPFVHEGCTLTDSTFGAYTEIGLGSRITNSHIGDYSYCDRYGDIANADVGKFANIASFVRIGATDHPLDTAACHHFLYRSQDYWDDARPDEDFLNHRRSRRAVIGHDCQRRSKIRPRGGAKLGHFGFTRDAGDERRPVSRALHVAGG